ncbi:MAG: bifunctional phosphopantothenoylcysteine decarboxylase/phosphopantothenate synthase, partial [Hyphomicrobiaceae bacterium]|nr:bifunctional phosphopantothenoylcysteine decarboxylase/phosphopantothenate synthase [Hyphomicrobiaceae bacterium]
KGCDWIVANDVSPASGTFGGEQNKVLIIRAMNDEEGDYEEWPLLDKDEVAVRLMRTVAKSFSNKNQAAE